MRNPIIQSQLLLCITVLLFCQCNSSNSNTEPRIYARDLLAATTAKDYDLRQDVETITEDSYYYYDSRESRGGNELTKNGKIKNFGRYLRTTTQIYDKEGKLAKETSTKMEGGNLALIDDSNMELYDNKGRRILSESYHYYTDYETGKRYKGTVRASDIYEDEEYETYRTNIVVLEDGYTEKTERYLFEEYDENHRIKKRYNNNHECIVMWVESKNDEEEFEYSEDGKLYRKTIYDTNGRLIECWSINKEGELYLSSKYVYDKNEKTQTYFNYENGTSWIKYYDNTDFTKARKSVLKDSEGNITDEITYLYDSRDNILNVISLIDSKQNTSYTYEYDDKDNWIIKKTTFASTETIVLNIRHIKYYDGYDSDKKLSEIINDYIEPSVIKRDDKTLSTPTSFNINSSFEPTFIPAVPTVMEPSEHELAKFGYVDKECPLCNNSGKCRTCDGKGWYDGYFGTGVLDCPNCEHGECPTCKGTKYIQVFRRLN